MQDPGLQKWRVSLGLYAPLFLWIGVILYMSGNQGSMTETSRFIGPLLQFLFPSAPEETLAVYHGLVRKAGHIAGYAILGFFAVRAFSRSPSENFRKLRYLSSFALVAAIAMIDELNQSYQASRTGSGWDILLDISGGAMMLLFLWMINRRRTEPDPTAEVRTK